MRPLPWLLLLSLMVAGCTTPNSTKESLTTSPLPPVYSPDNGDGTYKNPIIFADYSDPDVCRAGDD